MRFACRSSKGRGQRRGGIGCSVPTRDHSAGVDDRGDIDLLGVRPPLEDPVVSFQHEPALDAGIERQVGLLKWLLRRWAKWSGRRPTIIWIRCRRSCRLIRRWCWVEIVGSRSSSWWEWRWKVQFVGCYPVSQFDVRKTIKGSSFRNSWNRTRQSSKKHISSCSKSL